MHEGKNISLETVMEKFLETFFEITEWLNQVEEEYPDIMNEVLIPNIKRDFYENIEKCAAWLMHMNILLKISRGEIINLSELTSIELMDIAKYVITEQLGGEKVVFN